jgi:hypothetical protein
MIRWTQTSLPVNAVLLNNLKHRPCRILHFKILVLSPQLIKLRCSHFYLARLNSAIILVHTINVCASSYSDSTGHMWHKKSAVCHTCHLLIVSLLTVIRTGAWSFSCLSQAPSCRSVVTLSRSEQVLCVTFQYMVHKNRVYFWCFHYH